MALHPDFPESPYAILDSAMRWFTADEALRETDMDKYPVLPDAPNRALVERQSAKYTEIP
jgi:type III restriction enzyme